MPAWNKRCIVPLQAPSAERDGSLTPARSPTAVERPPSANASPGADSGNLPESEGANADEAARSSSSHRPHPAALQKPDPAAATNAQESKLAPGTQKRSYAGMEPAEIKQDQQSQQAEAEQAFPAIADKISLLFQLYEFAKNATDATADTWAAVLSAPTDDVRRWLAWKQSKDGIVRQPAPKRRKVSHQRSSSAASSVKLESPVVASRVVNPNQETGHGANHVADITPTQPIEDRPDPVSGTAAAPAPIMLPPQQQPQPATMNPNDLHIQPPATITRPSSTTSASSAAQNRYPTITSPVVPRPPSQASTPALTPSSTRASLPPAYLPPSATSPAVSLYPTSSALAYASEQAQMMAQLPVREQRISRPRVDAGSGPPPSYTPILPAGQHPAPPYALAPGHPVRRNSTTSMATTSPATPVSPDTLLFPNVRPSSRSGPAVPSGPFIPSQQQVQQALANGMRAYHNPNMALVQAPIVPTQAPPHPQPPQAQPHTLPNTHAVDPAHTQLVPVPQDAPRSLSPGGRDYVWIGNTWLPIEHVPPPPQQQQQQQQQPRVPMQHPQRLQHAGHVPGTLPPQFAPVHSQQRFPVVPTSRPQPSAMPQQLVHPPPRPAVRSQHVPHQPRTRRKQHKGFECRDPDELLRAPPAEQLAYCVDERQHWIDELDSVEAHTEPGYADNCRIRIRAVDSWIAELMRRGLVAPPSRIPPPRPAVATAQRHVAAAQPAQPHVVPASASREVIVIPDTPEPPPSQTLHDDDAGPTQQRHLPTPAPTAVAPGDVAVRSRTASAVPERVPVPSLQISSQATPAAKPSPTSAIPTITVEEQMQQRDAVFAYLDACARTPLDVFVPPPPLRFEPHSSRGEHRASVAPYVDEWRRLHAPGAGLLKHISAHQRRALAPPSPETPAGQLPPSLPAVERELQLQNQPMDVDAAGPSDEGRALVLRARSTGAHGIVTPDATPEPAPRPESQSQALVAASPAVRGLFKDLMSIFEKIEVPRSLAEDGMDAGEHMRALVRLNPDQAGVVGNAKQLDELLQPHVEKSNYILAAIERGALSHLGFLAPAPSTSSAPSPAP